jgi:hypothetical protein
MVTVVSAVFILVAMGFVGYLGGDYIFSLYEAFAMSLLGGLALARFHCRREYTPWRFTRWLFIWFLAINTVMWPLTGLAYMAIRQGRDMYDLHGGSMVSEALQGLAGGVGLCLVFVPLLLLTFRNRYYRDQFEAILRFDRMKAPETANTTHDRPVT